MRHRSWIRPTRGKRRYPMPEPRLAIRRASRARTQPVRALLIMNPVSGDREPNTEKVAEIETHLARGKIDLEVAYTAPERSASKIAREALTAGVKVVIVGGGDGTVSEVARELVGQRAILGILPIGTFNNIARSLGVLGDLGAACGVIIAGHTREIDAGIANDEQVFFEAAGAGLDATLFPIGEEIKGGRWMRIWQAIALTLRFRMQTFEITFDRPVSEALAPHARRRMSMRVLVGRTLRRRALLVVAANGPYYGSGFTVAPAARLSDGLLTVTVYREFSKWELIRHFRSIARGKHHYSPKLETYTAAEVRLVSSAPMPVHVDGHPLGHTPVVLRVLPRALRVFARREPLHVEDRGPARLSEGFVGDRALG